MDVPCEPMQPVHPVRRFLRKCEAVALPHGEVHFWAFDLHVPSDADPDAMRLSLSVQERERLARCLRPDQRRRFALARVALREVLGAYLGTRPDKVALGAGDRGKPLMANSSDSWLHFNLSHSHDAAVIACARDRAVGVDIEQVRPNLECDAIVERFFSASEKREWGSLPPSGRRDAFLRGWTCKEAYVKALGDGMFHPPEAYTVRLNPAGPPALLDDSLQPGAEFRWTLYVAPVPAGYAAAIAAAGADAEIVCHPWASL